MSHWEIYQRGSIPLHTLHQAVLGYFQFCRGFFGYQFSEFIYFADLRSAYFIYGKKTIKLLSRSITENILTDSRNNFQKQWVKITKNLHKINAKIINTNLSKFSNKQKLVLYKNIVSWLEKFHAYTAISIDLLDLTLEKVIKDNLPKKFQTRGNLNLLLSPIQPSFVVKKEKELVKLVSSPKESNLKKFQQNYFWVNFSWQEQPSYTGDQIKKDLVAVKSKRNLIEIKIRESEKEFSEIKKQKLDLLRKINSSRVNNLVTLSDRMMFYHDDRKKNQMIALYAINKILKSIKEYKFEDLLWCKTEEIIDYLKNNIPINLAEIAKRKQGTMITILNNKLTLKSGPETKTELNRLLYGEKKLKNVRELKGVSSSPGKVRGKVKIIFDPRGMLHRVTKNNILVTPMTTPDFVPIMKKVAAIVTDEGGITCHAAIISRELGVPCITATKHATNILQDDDYVEVDADHGIVKKLKDAKRSEVRQKTH